MSSVLIEEELVKKLELDYNRFNMTFSIYCDDLNLKTFEDVQESYFMFLKSFNECTKDLDLQDINITFDTNTAVGVKIEKKYLKKIEDVVLLEIKENFDNIELYKMIIKKAHKNIEYFIEKLVESSLRKDLLIEESSKGILEEEFFIDFNKKEFYSEIKRDKVYKFKELKN